MRLGLLFSQALFTYYLSIAPTHGQKLNQANLIQFFQTESVEATIAAQLKINFPPTDTSSTVDQRALVEFLNQIAPEKTFQFTKSSAHQILTALEVDTVLLAESYEQDVWQTTADSFLPKRMQGGATSRNFQNFIDNSPGLIVIGTMIGTPAILGTLHYVVKAPSAQMSFAMDLVVMGTALGLAKFTYDKITNRSNQRDSIQNESLEKIGKAFPTTSQALGKDPLRSLVQACFRSI